MAQVPSKLKFKWTGPHKVIRMLRDNTVLFNHEACGEMFTDVNRLYKCPRWNRDHVSTDPIPEQAPLGEVQPEDEEEDEVQGRVDPFSVRGEPQGGHLIAFKMTNGEDSDKPDFGIGVFTELKTGCECRSLRERRCECALYYHFQWLANTNDLAHGVHRPMWLDPRDRKCYFQIKPTSPTHKRITNLDTNTWIKRSDILAYGFQLEKTKLPGGLCKFLSDHSDIAWKHPRYAERDLQ